jgi:hypothetical protein
MKSKKNNNKKYSNINVGYSWIIKIFQKIPVESALINAETRGMTQR